MSWSHNRFTSPTRLNLRPTDPHRPGQVCLTDGIFDANIKSSDPDNIRITLWREWPDMLADLAAVGPVWSIVRNAHCVLAVHARYPELTYSSNQQSALARRGEGALACHFRAWHNATAFDSACHLGRLYGFEIADRHGEIFHRVCVAPEADPAPFIAWSEQHQATGLEEDPDLRPVDEGRFHPQSFRRTPGTLEVPLDRLRTALIRTAQREIPLLVSVASEGAGQTARIEVLRASETEGHLMLSGNQVSLCVDTEPTGTLLVEPASAEGESVWRLSLTDPAGRRLLHLHSTPDAREDWNQLVREFVLCSTTT